MRYLLLCNIQGAAMNDPNQFHFERAPGGIIRSVPSVDSPSFIADLSSNNDSSYNDNSSSMNNWLLLDTEVVMVEAPGKRKRGRPRKYPCLPNNGKTFNCVPTSRFLIYPSGSPLIKNNMLVVAKLIYHRSYSFNRN